MSSTVFVLKTVETFYLLLVSTDVGYLT